MSAVMCSRCGMLVEKCECRVVFGMTVREYDARLAEQRRLAQERFERDIVEKFKAANDARIAARSHPSRYLGIVSESVYGIDPQSFDEKVVALIADAEAICIHAAKTLGGDA